MCKRSSLVLTVALLLGLMLSSCKPSEKLAKSINLVFAEPLSIDPGLVVDNVSTQYVQQLFMGLTTYDAKTLEPKPWLCKNWAVSADGLVWTFALRGNIYWVRYDPATGTATKKRAVSAEDIEYAVRRAVDPVNGSGYAYVDYIIQGAQAVNSGQSVDVRLIGVKALNDTTVEFTLTEPAGYFPYIAGLWTNNPVPREVVEGYGDRWTQPGIIWTCGAYMLASWEHGSTMVMKKNPYWFDARNVSIEQINFNGSAAFARYEAGEFDLCNVPWDQLARVKADPELSKELRIVPYPCTQYLGFNTSKPPLDNVKVRQALSYAIDRQKLIRSVLKAEDKPAKSFACPGIFGSPAEDPSFKGIEFDPAKARALLAEAGYPDGKGLPDITYMSWTGEYRQEVAEFIRQGWKENLGVEVRLAHQEFSLYLKTVSTDTPQIYHLPWCADYMDESNWVTENFHTAKSPNNPKWYGPDAEAFDKLVEDAGSATDPAVRKKKYYEAERLLCVEDAVIAPLFYTTLAYCVKPYVEGTYAPMGGDWIYYWKVHEH